MPEKIRFLDRKTPPHIATLVIITAAGALNMNVVLPSLPGIAEYFSVSYSYVQLLISAYLAATAVMQLLIGPLSDRYGRRLVMLISLAVFLAASILCIFAPNFETLLAGRMIQTVVVSGIALSRAVVRDMVGMEDAASLIGYISMGMAVVPMFGPLIGGVLDEIFGWQAAFFVTMMFGALALLLVFFDMGETKPQHRRSIQGLSRIVPVTTFLGLCSFSRLHLWRIFRLPGWRPLYFHKYARAQPLRTWCLFRSDRHRLYAGKLLFRPILKTDRNQ